MTLRLFGCVLLVYIIQCTAGTETMWKENPKDPHGGEPLKKCPLKLAAHFKKLERDVSCMPRLTIVKLRPEPGYFLEPDRVLVPRCGGDTNKLSCLPTNTTKKVIMVNKIKESNVKDKTCFNVDVEVHISCNRRCTLMATNCTGNQQYMEDTCTCKCMVTEGSEKMRTCENTMGMTWNKESCKCMCMKEQLCSSGYYWVPKMCRCVEMKS